MVELTDLESSFVSVYMANGCDTKKAHALVGAKNKNFLKNRRVMLAIEERKAELALSSKIDAEKLTEMALEVKDRARQEGRYFAAELKALEMVGKWNGIEKPAQVNVGLSFNQYARMLNEETNGK